MQDKFLVYEQQPALAQDSLRSTHPVSTKVDNPSQISEIFDYVSYSKGNKLYCPIQLSLNIRYTWCIETLEILELREMHTLI